MDPYQIIRNNYQRILAYGCSHTEGEELGDHGSLGITFDECNQMKKKFKSISKFESSIHRGNTVREWFKVNDNDNACRQLSYANQLAKMLNIPIENRAQGGSSQEKIYWLIVDDYRKGKITKDDILLVGTTDPDRMTIMELKQDHIQTEGITVDNRRFINGEQKFLFQIWPFDQFLWWFWNWLKLTKIFSEQKKISLLIVPATHEELFPKRKWKYPVHPHIEHYCNQVYEEIKPFLLGSKGLEHFEFDSAKPQLAGWGHFSPYNHTEYAKYLYDELKLFRNFI